MHGLQETCGFSLYYWYFPLKGGQYNGRVFPRGGELSQRRPKKALEAKKERFPMNAFRPFLLLSLSLSWTEVMGYVGSALVLISFLMTSVVKLRIVS